jgi:hypothetical protein
MDAELRDDMTNARWQYAKTMPTWPHEYTVKSRRPDLATQFMAFCRVIVEEGFVEPWPPAPSEAVYHNHYLVIDGHKYWGMGPHGDQDHPDAPNS